MNQKTEPGSILIIGGGFAGLAAGIYAQMNGYKTTIFEMHDQPGGLCTAWKRRGYTIDGCIHWLVGSSPNSGIHDFWEDTGIARNLRIIDMDEYMRFEGNDGRTLIFYTDLDRLREHLLEFSPEDKDPILDFINGIKMCLTFDFPSRHDSPVKKLRKGTAYLLNLIVNGRKMKKWMNTTALSFSKRFHDPLLAKAFLKMWLPDFSMFFMLFTFAYLHKKNAGYPLGGSMPMSEAMAERYTSLGGTIHYRSKVIKILTENKKASGIKLEDGTSFYAQRIISAADGYSTLFKMLDEKFGDEATFAPYKKWKTFPPLIYAGIGVNRTFDDLPFSVSGTIVELGEPVVISGTERHHFMMHVFNHDPSMAPEGKTIIIVMMYGDYDYWKNLDADPDKYQKAKKETGEAIVSLLEKKFPGISQQVEMVDIATPLTFERYTGNWKGSFEGWQITPENSGTLLKPMQKTISGLKRFYMCGQWVEPGGGLPTAVISARKLIKMICREDRKKFHTL